MANILKNPNMGNWKHGSYFTQKDGQVGTIEYPDGWEFVTLPKESDPNKLAESLHRDNGFVISAGYRSWEAGYVQKGIQLKGNQRYLAKAAFKPDVNFPVGQPERTDAVMWQHRITASTGESVEQGWQMTGKGQYKQQEENLFVFHTAAPVTVNYAFLARSVYAGNDCDLWVYQLVLEEVAPDYGGANVPVIGQAAATISSAPQAPEMPSTENIEPEPMGLRMEAAIPAAAVEAVESDASSGGKALGDVLSAEEIDQIAASLRTLAAINNQSIATGLNKLAEALERLK
jgi:hypothetical protein